MIKLEGAFTSTTTTTVGKSTANQSNGGSKKHRWFSRKRIIHKTDPSQNDTNLVQLYFNTKRANSVLEENFLHPISALPSMSIAADGDSVNGGIVDVKPQQQQQQQRRRLIFGGSIKKRIGPIEEKNKSNLFHKRTNGIDERISIADSNQMHALRQTIETSSKHNSIVSATSNHDDAIDDEEQGHFIMAPTNTDCTDSLHPLECETRQILHKIGIDWEMLSNAIESGPRSDIIGAYRIVINRLQKRKIMMLKQQHQHQQHQQHDQPNAELMPMIQRKSDKMCAIL